jgi:hypothetical protein
MFDRSLCLCNACEGGSTAVSFSIISTAETYRTVALYVRSLRDYKSVAAIVSMEISKLEVPLRFVPERASREAMMLFQDFEPMDETTKDRHYGTGLTQGSGVFVQRGFRVWPEGGLLLDTRLAMDSIVLIILRFSDSAEAKRYV